MIIDLNTHSGLLFGLEADPVYEMGDDGNLTGEATPAITVYIGFLSISFIFAKPQQE